MKALSIRQPWAWLIVNGYKDVENRTWDCPRTFHPPERIYVHAGLKPSNLWICHCGERVASARSPHRYGLQHTGYDHLLNELVKDWGAREKAASYCYWLMADYFGNTTAKQWRKGKATLRGCGAIVGEVTVNAWTDSWGAGSRWYEGPYGLILCDPVAYAEPIPYKGRQGLFEVDLP